MRRLLRRLGILPAGVSTPRRPLTRDPHYDPEAFGRFSEGVARLIGTARFLVFQTVIVIAWIGLNIAFDGLRFDEYPFILLTLALSLQAAYAAPLILLAQTRQGERDRITSERDRRTAVRTRTEAEYLAREIASIRLALGELGGELHDVRRASRDIAEAVARLETSLTPGSEGPREHRDRA
ncbi:MAG: DUF1003 domain-containing protein [Thermoleophilia bacterium]|nr:DUF1003 domain-containing protein [Thermoleophilia bacterium]